MIKYRMSILFEDGKVIVRSKDTGHLVAKERKSMDCAACALLVRGVTNCSKLWHERFGHIIFGTLGEMSDGHPLITAQGGVCKTRMEGK